MGVDVKLFDFLKENKTGMFRRDREVIAYVHVDFFKLDEFIEVVGEHWFDEGGIEDCVLFRDSVCVELNDIIESQGHSLLAYQNCFSDSDIHTFESYLKGVR